MSNRYLDWFRQAEADLQHARHSLAVEDFEWSCFAAHQAAEKAIKSVFLKSGMDAWGHTIIALLGSLPDNIEQPAEEMLDKARILDKYYIPTVYPNGFESGAPTDFYTEVEATLAIGYAEEIIEFCRNQID